jgi:hypothetical protein
MGLRAPSVFDTVNKGRSPLREGAMSFKGHVLVKKEELPVNEVNRCVQTVEFG